MLLLLVALLQAASPPQETKATLQSCETTEKGWVCHYQIPSASTIVRPLDAPPPAMAPAPVVGGEPKPPSLAPADSVEASRQTRLIARCADAKWYSPGLPGERKEARLLRDAAVSAATLRSKVTTLLSENRCDEAVKTALEGGDLSLAREAREFCATAH